MSTSNAHHYQINVADETNDLSRTPERNDQNNHDNNEANNSDPISPKKTLSETLKKLACCLCCCTKVSKNPNTATELPARPRNVSGNPSITAIPPGSRSPTGSPEPEVQSRNRPAQHGETRAVDIERLARERPLNPRDNDFGNTLTRGYTNPSTRDVGQQDNDIGDDNHFDEDAWQSAIMSLRAGEVARARRNGRVSSSGRRRPNVRAEGSLRSRNGPSQTWQRVFPGNVYGPSVFFMPCSKRRDALLISRGVWDDRVYDAVYDDRRGGLSLPSGEGGGIAWLMMVWSGSSADSRLYLDRVCEKGMCVYQRKRVIVIQD